MRSKEEEKIYKLLFDKLSDKSPTFDEVRRLFIGKQTVNELNKLHKRKIDFWLQHPEEDKPSLIRDAVSFDFKESIRPK